MTVPKTPWPPVFRVVRQAPGSKDCTACVAAMALGLTLEEAKWQMQGWQLPDGSIYYRQTDLIKILGAYGVVMGFYFRPGDVEKGEYVVKDVRLTLDVPLKGMVCVIGVKSKTQAVADHCVFFDGENVLDPQHDEPQSITDYRILDIYPLLYYVDKPWDEAEKPAAPPEMDLAAMAKCLVDNPSWDNLLCGRYGRILAQYYLDSTTKQKPMIYDRFVKNLKDAGITLDGGNVRIDAPAQLQHSDVVEILLHKIQFTFDIPLDIVFDDVLREEMNEQAYESIKDYLLNGHRSGNLIHYEKDKTIRGEWKILEEPHV